MSNITGYVPAIMGIGVALVGYAAARFIHWKAHRDILARERMKAGEHEEVILQHAE